MKKTSKTEPVPAFSPFSLDIVKIIIYMLITLIIVLLLSHIINSQFELHYRENTHRKRNEICYNNYIEFNNKITTLIKNNRIKDANAMNDKIETDLQCKHIYYEYNKYIINCRYLGKYEYKKSTSCVSLKKDLSESLLIDYDICDNKFRRTMHNNKLYNHCEQIREHALKILKEKRDRPR